MEKNLSIFIFLSIISFSLLAFNNLEYPLNDEWIYVRSAKNFADSGKLACEGCTTSGLFHVLIAGILIKYFGFKFYVLRLLVAIFAAFSVGLTFLIIKKITADNFFPALISLTLLSNPIFFNLSSLYMTDIPFLFFSLLSIYLIFLGLEKGNSNYFILMSIFSSLNIFIRQTAFLIPASFFLFLLLFQRKQLENNKVLISIILPILFFILFFIIQKTQTGVFYSQEFDVKNPLGFSLSGIFHFWSSLIYLGFFFLPAFILILNRWREKPVLFILILFIIPALILNLPSFQSLNLKSMPYLTNILHKSGLGAITIPGISDKSNILPEYVWIIITLLSIISLAVIFEKAIRSFFFSKVSYQHYILLLSFAFLFFIIIKRGAFFDRNLIIFIPLLGFLFTNEIKTKKHFIFLFSVFLFFSFSYSLLGQLDYLEWNRARYTAINNLIESGIALDEINGGFEYCLFHYGMKFQYDYWKKIGVFDSEDYRPHDWQFCPRSDYIISFSESPQDFQNQNYKTYKPINYCVFKNFHCDNLYILKLSS